MAGFPPTEEQLDAMAAAKQHTKLKLEAKAGSGKTSTLALIAEDNPVRSLYITFNKNMADEAKHRFPGHVEVRTSHSLAYAAFGAKIAHKLVRPKGAYQNVCGTGAEIARHFKIAPFVVTVDKSISGTAMGYAVKSTLARFEFSSDEKISEKHVSFYEAEKVIKESAFNKAKYVERVLKFAKMLWELRINVNSPIMATHDTYLKLYQLAKPDLSRYEIIYLDEAHDSSACLMDIVYNHPGRIILVGDVFQAIYAWRGAVNAMENTNWETRYLTKSFRFGPKIADIAQTILLDKWGEKSVKIQGYEKLDSKVVMAHQEKKFTWVFRTNAVLLATAVDLIEKGKKVNIEVDIYEFRTLMLSALALRAGNMKEVKHHDLVSFNTWVEFEEDLEISRKAELKRVYGYIMNGMAGKILKALDNYKPCKNADITLTTAHKSKGLEWDVVVLADDFLEFATDEEDGSWIGWSDQDRNLLYVAATRAKKILVINALISDLINYLTIRKNYLTIDTVDIKAYDPACSVDFDKEVRAEMVKIAGAVGLMSDLDLFVEGTPNSNSQHWTYAMDSVKINDSMDLED